MRGHEERARYEFTRGKLQAANAALQDLARMSHVHFTNPRVLADLRRKYEPQRKQDRAKLNEFHIEQQEIDEEEMQWARRHLLVAENEEIIGAFHQGVLSQTVYEKLLADIDARLLNLESAERGDLQKTASSTAAQGQND